MKKIGTKKRKGEDISEDEEKASPKKPKVELSTLPNPETSFRNSPKTPGKKKEKVLHLGETHPLNILVA